MKNCFDPKEFSGSDIEKINAALDAAGEDGLIVSVGSLYLAGAVRTAFPEVCHGIM